MNRISIIVGVVATFSFVCASLLFHRIGTLYHSALFENPPDSNDDHSSLEKDIEDVLDILPLEDIRQVVENHAKHDKQINDTVGFINDQKKFICQELKSIPHIQLFIFVMKELRLDTEHWSSCIGNFFDSLPPYEGPDAKGEIGGLTGMINRIFRLVPRDELHELLCRKVKESKSFRMMQLMLKSQQFYDLCSSIQNNNVLQRHFYWAKESGIEIIFATELLGDLYLYLTREVY